jgi:methionine-rich copper-binding protein CopC
MLNRGRGGPLLALLAALLFVASAAHAHAIVVSSEPPPGATLAGSALSVQLRFNSRIDHVRSRLMLIAPDGTNVVLAMAASQAPETLTAKASDLRPGRYRLRWQVMSIDGHITRGDIPFEVVR